MKSYPQSRSSRKIVKEPLFPLVDPTLVADIRHGNANTLLAGLGDLKVDLVVTSPPYNVGKSYETKRSIADYLNSQEAIIQKLVDALSDHGSICWQVGNYVNKGEVFPLDVFYYQIFKRYNLKLRNRIIWYFGHGLHASNRFSGRYETILWFTKTDQYIFNLDDVRVRSKYPGKRHFKGPRKGQLSGNPRGKNPADVWEILLRDWELELWDIPNVKSNHPEKTQHPCQFPIELVERCILALTIPGGWVLDPFGGVGSTVLAALRTGRNSIAFEKDLSFCKMGRQRVQALKDGKLKVRPMTKPIHRPSPKDKVAQVPLEWA